MNSPSDTQLSVELSRLAAQHGATTLDQESAPSAELLLTSITVFQDLVRISADLQGQAARAAHEEGVSWAKIGTLLGTSRQAVQQRFDPNYIPRECGGETMRILGPVSRDEEIHHLTEAGLQGWRLISSSHGEHTVERDDQNWDVKRVSVLSARTMPSRKDGWQAATIRFPDCFYIRPHQIHLSDD